MVSIDTSVAKPAFLRRWHNLTELRLFFAFSVVLSHTIQLAGYNSLYVLRVVFSSKTAVDAFFILSGFLVVASYERCKDNLDFYRRRFLRIYPAYVVAVLFFLSLGIVQAMAKGFAVSAIEVLKYLAANLALANFLKPTVDGVFATNQVHEINGALWTIKVEASFYVIVPLVCYFARRTSYHVAAATLMLIGLGWVAFLGLLHDYAGVSIHESLYYQLPGEMQYFGLGVLLYAVHRAHHTERLAGFMLLAIAAFAALIGQAWTGAEMIVLSALIYFVIHLPRLKTALADFDISYGVYLSHFPIIQLLLSAADWQNLSFVLLPLVGLLTALWAVISWYTVEQPSIGMAKRLAV